MFTLDRLRAAAVSLATQETERDPVPAAIERLCNARVGKPITKRDVADLEREIPGLQARIHKDSITQSVEISYWVSVSKSRNHQTGEDEIWASGWTGQRDAQGEAIRDPQRVADELALYSLGVPGSGNSAGIKVRQSKYADAARAQGTVRWPTVAELRKWNPSDYGARDERNAARTATLTALASSGPDGREAYDLPRIAQLVDEINLMAEELRAYLVDDDSDSPQAYHIPTEVVRVVADALTVALEKK
jgi:hypothetical protein